MRGQEQLIAMRLRGHVPRYGVHIATDAEDHDWPMAWQQICNEWRVQPETAEIYIAATDPVQRLDLRPLVGLLVTVRGCNADRVRAVSDAAQRAGAQRVIGIVNEADSGKRQTIEIFDSKGLMTWHK